jgi:hypothetical protein
MLYVIGTKALETVTVTSVRSSRKPAGDAFPVVYGPFGGRKPRKGDVLALSREASGFVAVAPR